MEEKEKKELFFSKWSMIFNEICSMKIIKDQEKNGQAKPATISGKKIKEIINSLLCKNKLFMIVKIDEQEKESFFNSFSFIQEKNGNKVERNIPHISFFISISFCDIESGYIENFSKWPCFSNVVMNGAGETLQSAITYGIKSFFITQFNIPLYDDEDDTQTTETQLSKLNNNFQCNQFLIDYIEKNKFNWDNINKAVLSKYQKNSVTQLTEYQAAELLNDIIMFKPIVKFTKDNWLEWKDEKIPLQYLPQEYKKEEIKWKDIVENKLKYQPLFEKWKEKRLIFLINVFGMMDD